jgi:NhaP-type Na+/H+ and K+/H+ antiporter
MAKKKAVSSNPNGYPILLIKLINGTELIGLVSYNTAQFLEVITPVYLQVNQVQNNTQVSLLQWSPFSDQKSVTLNTLGVLCTLSITDDLKNLYLEAISGDNLKSPTKKSEVEQETVEPIKDSKSKEWIN